MQHATKWFKSLVLSALIGSGLLGCGGGGGSSVGPKLAVGKVYVMGDSLADVGTFGFKFTVQDAYNRAAGYPIWPQLVTNLYGLNGSAQCNFFSYSTTQQTFQPNTTEGCTNFAIGGGRIVVSASSGGASNPMTIATQMIAQTAGYASTDLILIDGGGNDAADLVGAYLGATANAAAYVSFLTQQLDANTVSGLLTQTNGGALVVAGAYMTKLADNFHDQIVANLLNNPKGGAQHVAILNMPDITLTPRMLAVLAGVEYQAGKAQAAALKAAIQQWVQAFNTELAAKFQTESRVTIVDFYTDFTNEVNHPADFNLTNVTTPACPPTGTDASGLPTYDFQSCTNTALDAIPGKTAGWWKSYAFSDNFHPTPYGHQLLSASVARALARAGWL
jgi:phospholipase/lecithinase/hemolysin